jgi:hypothetical protein
MKENFFTSMLMDGGKISHKRWISVTVGAVLCWAIWYAMVHATTDDSRKEVIHAVMLFILIMSGVATVAQIANIVKGNQTPPIEPPKETKNEETT